ncbi:hypothetical protein, partial [Klebsiella pneumoniae]|uniref:hypothetical protein n=1 Tax=Klebsiella pneumoniae TaxID=573 RepID=UPI0040556BDC
YNSVTRAKAVLPKKKAYRPFILVEESSLALNLEFSGTTVGAVLVKAIGVASNWTPKTVTTMAL